MNITHPIIRIPLGIAMIITAVFFLYKLLEKDLEVLPNASISVFIDITDEGMAQPNGKQVLSLLKFDKKYMWSGATVRLIPLTNVNFNPIREVTLPSRNKWLSNELSRKKELLQFKEEVVMLFSPSYSENIGREHSSLYGPIMDELMRLYAKNDKRKIMIIYSDLMENSTELSLYNKKQFQAFVSNPTEQFPWMENFSQLPDLSDIQVYLIYQPENVQDNYRYTRVSEVIKKILENKGATVYRGANISL
jgi:hypothetical protein